MYTGCDKTITSLRYRMIRAACTSKLSLDSVTIDLPSSKAASLTRTVYSTQADVLRTIGTYLRKRTIKQDSKQDDQDDKKNILIRIYDQPERSIHSQSQVWIKEQHTSLFATGVALHDLAFATGYARSGLFKSLTKFSFARCNLDSWSMRLLIERYTETMTSLELCDIHLYKSNRDFTHRSSNHTGAWLEVFREMQNTTNLSSLGFERLFEGSGSVMLHGTRDHIRVSGQTEIQQEIPALMSILST